MTAYALVIWSYTQKGSALRTALLMVCSYAPYVICSIFAGALSDRWDKKKTMLCCDALAALSTLIVLLLLKNDSLRIWHLYVVNAVSGLMNTVCSPFISSITEIPSACASGCNRLISGNPFAVSHLETVLLLTLIISASSA